jgi:tRNA1Val (adenine37-N6)-methyltransferase
LDIGAGTGLLMLMLAQQWSGPIDGIEIDKDTREQAMENIQASPWADRLQVLHGDIVSAALPAAYDLIISNPPFYEGDLTSPARHKNLAKHDAGLTLEGLLAAAHRCAAPGARLAVLLPFHRLDGFRERAAVYGWQPARQLLVRQTPAHDYFRAVLWLEKQYAGAEAVETLTIHTTDRVYSEGMIALLKPYYLYL